MSDLIDRQAAIDAVNCVMVMTGIRSWKSIVSETVESAKRIMTDNIRDLPPAQPERIKGHWIRNGWAITCSECGYDMPYTARRFCPNCGADMRGEQDG